MRRAKRASGRALTADLLQTTVIAGVSGEDALRVVAVLGAVAAVNSVGVDSLETTAAVEATDACDEPRVGDVNDKRDHRQNEPPGVRRATRNVDDLGGSRAGLRRQEVERAKSVSLGVRGVETRDRIADRGLAGRVTTEGGALADGDDRGAFGLLAERLDQFGGDDVGGAGVVLRDRAPRHGVDVVPRAAVDRLLEGTLDDEDERLRVVQLEVVEPLVSGVAAHALDRLMIEQVDDVDDDVSDVHASIRGETRGLERGVHRVGGNESIVDRERSTKLKGMQGGDAGTLDRLGAKVLIDTKERGGATGALSTVEPDYSRLAESTLVKIRGASVGNCIHDLGRLYLAEPSRSSERTQTGDELSPGNSHTLSSFTKIGVVSTWQIKRVCL